jgi:protein ImuB
MAGLLQAFSLLNGESPATLPADVASPRRAQQLWVAVSLLDCTLCSTASDPHPLTALAAHAYELTSLVCVEEPDGLLLEVRGSLKLFGGIAAVKKKLALKLDGRRMRFDMCAAPTPYAALWLAREARADALESSSLAGCLSTLPLAATRWPDDVRLKLTEMGVRTVGDCLRLPRDGFARRIGEPYLHQLDQALGKRPDLRREIVAQPSLSGMIEFPAEITQTAALAGALQSIVTSLAADLRRRQRQVQNLCIVFHHARRPPTLCRLQLIEPAHEVRRLLDPLIVRLERLVLPAPVIALGVDAGVPVAMRIEAVKLFADDGGSGQVPVSPAALIESLRARFGNEGVYGLEWVNEHRPERVWSKLTEKLLHGPARVARPPKIPNRPLWILPSPVPLAERCSEARRETVADEIRTNEPERIESGWWDGGDIRRDYYTVTTRCGQRLWVYQDCATRSWYLHGIFG